MPERVSNSVEKNVVSVPVNPIVVAAITSTDVLPDAIKVPGELAARYIQNVGANDCYYAFGHDCKANNFNGVLAKAQAVDANGFGPGQQLDVSNCGEKVSIWSVGGTTIAVTILKRNDLAAGTGGIL